MNLLLSEQQRRPVAARRTLSVRSELHPTADLIMEIISMYPG